MPRRPASSDLVAWMLVGASLGLAAGYLAAELAAPLRAGRVPGRLPGGTRPPAGSSLADLARAALAGDPALRDLELEVLPATAGVVELHGWVPSRTLRARAGRVVAATAAIRTVVNCLLVRGEDDLGIDQPDDTGPSA
ncbi:MAG: BON domain-containing protein [Gemmatimonadota bacterium]|nr:BON domain-containing protein [Gemmatimonadota bacterium]MDH4349504.1 BON domain-containing protein [Gemmatimonadota bacterium]